MTLNKRLSLIIDNGRIEQVFYPVFPPDRNAADVMAWLERRPRG
jgi:peroxiredoxin (alkyl hydroperoxide reductase subunit C)